MGILSGALQRLDGLQQEGHKQQIASALGIDRALLDPEPPPTPEQTAWAQVEALACSINHAAECVEEALGKLEIPAPVDYAAQLKSLTAGLADALRAAGKAQAQSSERQADAIKALTSELAKHNPEAVAKAVSGLKPVDLSPLVAALKPGPRKPTRFDIVRREDGLMEYVVAVPLDEYTPVERMRFE